jgi:peptidoglycan hydrolase-like protein with peptidoglycan-binding domain
MKSISRPAAACAAFLCMAALPAAANATAPVPSVPVAPTPPVVTPPPAPTPVAGKIKLVLQKLGGKPHFAITDAPIVVRGVVIPYVAGQSVKVSFYRDGRKVGVKTLSVLAIGNGAGQFHLHFSSAKAGLLQVRAAHYATAQQLAFSGRSASLRVADPNVSPGSGSPSVRLMQSELSQLHFEVPLSGVFDEATGRALVAYRKMTGLERVPEAGRQVFKLLLRGAGTFTVRYPHDGRHIEADLTKQVLAEIEPGGHVRLLYTMSSGKPSTPTVIGRFTVYNKEPGTNSHGMVDSSYFIRGYAIHGYAEVPNYAASHGCLRVPIPNAPAIYSWVQYGMPVDVYNENGGGSARVRADAGP